MASVSATDLNTTDEITGDSIGDIVSIENSEEVISIENADDLSVSNDSEVLGNTYYPKNYDELRNSIGNANTGDTIILSGTYYFKSQIKIPKKITLIGTNNAIVDGQGSTRLFVVDNYVVFKNITFQNGKVNKDDGGAIYTWSSMAIDNCRFINNYAGWSCGAIYIGKGANYNISNSYFERNSGEYGGALAIRDINSNTKGLIYNCTFYKNTGRYSYGAIECANIEKCTFIENRANDGYSGAIGEYNAVYTVKDCTFIRNYATKNGGALHFISNNGHSVSNCYFEGNSAGRNGGSIMVDDAVSNLNIVNSTIIKSSSSLNGGGIFVGTIKQLMIDNCNFEECHANSYGGAIEARPTGNLNILNCNFNDCYSTNDNGGAIHTHNVNTVNVKNCNFYNCHSQQFVGAVDLYKASNFNVLNCSFIDCYCNTNDGGAMCISLSNSGNVSGCYFDSCTAKSNGGAIRLGGSTKTNIMDSTFVNCSADNGGAIRLHVSEDTKNSEVTIDNCNFNGNSANNVGGAISTYQSSNLKIFNSNFTNSSSKSLGGAVSSCEDNGGSISGCYFDSCNSKDAGGAISLEQSSKFNVENSEFANCTSVNDGAAVYLNKGSNLKINDCAFEDCISENGVNSISFGGATSGYDIFNCIFDINPQGINFYCNPVLSVNNLSIVRGDDGIISAKLSNVHGPLSNKQVVFTVNGKNYDRTTTSDGIATFNVKDYLTDYGSQNVTVSYEGDSLNTPVSQTVNVMINRYKAVLTITQSERNYYGEKILSFKVVDYKTGVGKAEAKIHLIIYSNGEIYKTDDIYTSSNGIVTYSLAAFEPNDYTIKAYVTSENVDVNAVEDNVVISKISGKIELSTSNNNKTLDVKLVNPSNGDVYKDITVSLEFTPNGVKDTVTTDANGEASFQLREALFGVGTYTVIAKVDSSGYKEFDTAQLNNIVISTLGKDDSVVRFSNEIVFDYLKSGSTTVTLEGCNIYREGCSVDNHPEASIVVKDNKITVSGLKAGNYTLRVTSTPDIYHNPVTRTVKIIVNKIDSSLTINKEVSFNYGDTGITTVTVNGGSIVKSGVSVEGHSEAIISVVNNEIYISNLTVDTYTLKVTTSPDSDYNSVTRYTKITVKKINSIIDFENPISFVYGGVGSVPLTLEGCEVVREGCSVDNHPEAIINIDKNNVVSVSNLSFGTYKLIISSIPDSNHYACTQFIVVNVNKANSNVDLAPKSFAFDYGTTGSANLILDGCSVLSDDVVVEGYSTAITRVADGVLYVSNLPANTYTLQIKTTPDGNHKSVTKKFSVTVNKPLSTVSFRNPVIFDYLGEGTTSMDLNGCTVDLEKISVVGHDEAVISKNNKGVITVSNLTAGSYTLKVVTDPDANHRANTATVAITVNKLDSKVIFTKEYISFKYAESGSTPISLENCKVASMSIVGHDDVKPVLDDDEITVSGLPVGSYVMKVTTDPDDNYNSVDAYINVTVVKNTATITVKKSQTVAYKKSTNWAITLKDSSGKPVSGVKVNLKIYKGNKLYKTVTNLKVTDANGVTNYNTKGLPVGTYKFVVSVSHSGYNVKSVSTPVKVIKQTAVKIILNTKSDKKGAVISVIVKDKAGKKYLNNIKINLYIKTGKAYGKPITLITGNYKNGKGVSAYSTNMLTVGSHNVKVETADIKYSGSASKNVKVLASAKKYRNWWEKISKGKKTSYGT